MSLKKNSKKKKNKSNIETWLVRILVIALVVMSVFIAKKKLLPEDKYANLQGNIEVEILGNVQKPGKYIVPYGTSNMELLRIAGVTGTSDLKNIDVSSNASSTKTLRIGKLKKQVALKKDVLPFVGAKGEVRITMGDVNITRDGNTQALTDGLVLKEKDIIETGADGIAEIKLGDGSLIDIEKNSKLELKSLFKMDADGLMLLEMGLKQGKIWAKVQPQYKNAKFLMYSDNSFAEIKSQSELILIADQNKSQLKLLSGLSKIGTFKDNKITILKSGQKADVDFATNSVKVARLSQLETDNFSTSTSNNFDAQKDQLSKQVSVMRFLFVGMPQHFFMIEINSSARRFAITKLPSNTPVTKYVNGVRNLDRAFLNGGIGLLSTLAERLLNSSISNYFIYSTKDFENAVNNIGGLSIKVDNLSARRMGIRQGNQLLTGSKVKSYLGNPSLKGFDTRMNIVVNGLFKGLIQKSILLSPGLAKQLVTDVETDVDTKDMMNIFGLLKDVANWEIAVSTYGGK